MRKVVAAINQTIDGFCDHTAGIADEELHRHYAELINEGGMILYGRKTFQLMKFWQELIVNPSENKTMNDFAVAIDKIPKIVFSHTLKDTEWDSAKLADKPLETVAGELKQQDGSDLLIGSRSLIIQLANLNLIDEYQLCIHPVVIGKGLPLFDKINDRTVFKLLKTKTFESGTIILYYSRI
jgi:dihydrofolate reductase